jgi:hypothetical protein
MCYVGSCTDRDPHEGSLSRRTAMKVIKNEEHKVTRKFEYDIPDEDIINTFGSLDRFKEIVSHNTDGWDVEVIGEEPTDEESDLFYDFFADYDYASEDDWWQDLKGGYETNYELGDE